MATLRFAVFGQPVTHSRSPEIHAAFARQFGLDLDYQRQEVGLAELPRRLAAFFADGGNGVNLTLPLKQAGCALVDRPSPEAALARAVNCVRMDLDGALSGHNTDGLGLIADLQRLGIPLARRRLLLLGAGGAAAGVLGPLLAQGPGVLMLANRDRRRALDLAARHGDPRLVPGTVEEFAAAEPVDLFIQATSAGHAGGAPWSALASLLGSGSIAYDLSYGPAARPFLDFARARGARTHDGFGMLIEQAALAFRWWLDRMPDTEELHATLRR